MYKIQTCVSKISNLFREAGFPIGRKTLTVRPPKIVMQSSTLIQKAFLKGYFDADGCLRLERSREEYARFKKTHHYYPRISLCSVSENLIVDIKRMLDLVSLRYGVYKQAREKFGRHNTYFVYINGASQLEFWMREIGTSNPVHVTKYLVWKKFGFCPPKTTLDQRIMMLSDELDPEILYEI